MIYATVAIIADGELEGEYIARTMAEVRELADAAIACGLAEDSAVEVWVLAHDHEPRDNDDCQCDTYLADSSAYGTFQPAEVPA